VFFNFFFLGLFQLLDTAMIWLLVLNPFFSFDGLSLFLKQSVSLATKIFPMIVVFLDCLAHTIVPTDAHSLLKVRLTHAYLSPVSRRFSRPISMTNDVST